MQTKLLPYIIIGVLVVAGVAGASWYFAIKQPAPLIEVVPPEEVPVDETANWKTYRNEEFGFSIKYPPDWEVRTNVISRRFADKSVSFHGGLDIAIPVFISETTTSKVIQAIQLQENPLFTKKEEIVINNASGFKLTSDFIYNDCKAFYYVFSKINTIFVIASIRCPTHSDELNTINEQMPYTFWFLE